jgi:DNA polymerase
MLQRLTESTPVTAPAGNAVRVLHRDYETRGRAVLKIIGSHEYAADAATEVLCCAYAVDDEPVQVWTSGDPVPAAFTEAARNPAWVVAAHGDHFETAIEQYILGPRYGWPAIPIERHRCTQALCLAHGLPARLSAAADALELANRKDAAGERLMHQTSKPRRAHKDENPDGIYWFEDQEPSIGFMTIAARTWKLNARYMGGCRRCRHRSNPYGS